MNVWKVTAVLEHEAVLNQIDGQPVINFTAVNTEHAIEEYGLKKRVTWIDAVWYNPDLDKLMWLKHPALVYLEGRPYLRAATRGDLSEHVNMAIEVTFLSFERLFPGGSKNRRPPGTASAD